MLNRHILSDDALKAILAVGEDVDLEGYQLSPGAVKFISKVILQGKKNVSSLNLKNCNIGNVGLYCLADALKRDHSSLPLMIDLRNNLFSLNGIRALAGVLASGVVSRELTLKFGNNNLTFSMVQSLARAISSGHAPKNLALYFDNFNPHAVAKCITALTNAVKSGHAPEGFELHLALRDQLSHYIVRDIASTISSGMAPVNYCLRLENMPHYVSLDHIGEAIIRENAPRGLFLDLSNNPQIFSAHSRYAKAIKNRFLTNIIYHELPQNLMIKLGDDCDEASRAFIEDALRVNQEKYNQVMLAALGSIAFHAGMIIGSYSKYLPPLVLETIYSYVFPHANWRSKKRQAFVQNIFGVFAEHKANREHHQAHPLTIRMSAPPSRKRSLKRKPAEEMAVIEEYKREDKRPRR